ncbi:unnamed protein product [Symbiodinium natans]|uniref:Uncharacterized protein n=1 Tax=Symbiodinium natans TaxID=878477 RepID=A0A812SMF9_9DINO|nr:unnamed protein product [Symbiodinium natans]
MGCAASVQVIAPAAIDFHPIEPTASDVERRENHFEEANRLPNQCHAPGAPRAPEPEEEPVEGSPWERVGTNDTDVTGQVSVKVIPSSRSMAAIARGKVLLDFEPQQARSFTSIDSRKNRHLCEEEVGRVDSFLHDIKQHPKIFQTRVNTRRKFMAILANRRVEASKSKPIF